MAEDLPDYNSAIMPPGSRAYRVYDSKGSDIADFYLQQRRSRYPGQISLMLFRALLLILRTSVLFPQWY